MQIIFAIKIDVVVTYCKLKMFLCKILWKLLWEIIEWNFSIKIIARTHQKQLKSWRRRAEFAKFNNLLKKFINHHQAKFAAFSLKRLLPPPRCACKMREECKKQFALWVMLEIKKYLGGWAGLAFQYVSIKWKTFVNDFSLSFVSLPCCLSISAEVSLSFKWIVLCLLAKLRLQTFHPSLCLSIYSSDLPFTLSAIICMWDVDIFSCFYLYNGTLTFFSSSL